jgi:hypothetical protein
VIHAGAARRWNAGVGLPSLDEFLADVGEGSDVEQPAARLVKR